jgi:hypothetical protein
VTPDTHDAGRDPAVISFALKAVGFVPGYPISFDLRRRLAERGKTLRATCPYCGEPRGQVPWPWHKPDAYLGLAICIACNCVTEP